MKLKKFNEFSVNEDTDPFNDSPETYIDITLKKLKGKVDAMFGAKPAKKQSPQTPEQARQKEETKKTFEELGLQLESSEISKYSKLYNSLTVKFSDENYMYHLYVMMKLADAISKDPTASVEQKDVDEAYIVFKKYDINTLEIVGQLSKNINTDKINEDYLIELKLELDKDFGDEEEEEFEIETED
jgi:hypothetical protein